MKEKWDDEYNLIIPDFTKNDFEKTTNLIRDKKKEELNNFLKQFKIESLNEYIKKKNIKNNEVTQWKFENSFKIFASKPNTALLNIAKNIKINQSIAALETSTGLLNYVVPKGYFL